ncbi:MAG: response regulator [Calditrichia bacterium]|nr:response regulator [Calditrichia bacterium]
MRFLIVEDDLTSRKVMQKLLKTHGESDSVVNGKEAIDAFSIAMEDNEPYDMIFMDIMMPEMDGQLALKKIRKHESELKISPKDEVPIIMTTALNSPKDVKEAYYSGGCSDYMVKPIDKERLINIMHEYLEKE